ncbi:hypothetical protein F5Y16DRAFT_374403 [Xylariaceae sp. FL0255]|nr:hypothetical protein F5Y16DRAFT_374403 [Xylariaceae sp. FL0255]
MSSSQISADFTSRLPNELLLSILEYGLSQATLAASALCCNRWNVLASSVLYKHIALRDTREFFNWVNTAPTALDLNIETLTISISTVIPLPEHTSIDPEAQITQLRWHLDQLAARIRQMTKLRSFSITTPPPHKLHPRVRIPDSSIASCLDNISDSCSSLELEIRNGPASAVHKDPDTHLCVSIRRLIPQLQFLRLDLPSLCPGCFKSQSPINPRVFVPIEAPGLRECIIVLAYPHGWASVEKVNIKERCKTLSADRSTAKRAVVASLLDLTCSGKAPLMKRLWAYDALPSPGPDLYSYGVYVRRDIIAQRSHTFPWRSVGTAFKGIAFFIRMPEETGGQDVLTDRDNAAHVIEENTWVTTVNGVRLPAALVETYQLEKKDYRVQTRADWAASTDITTELWLNEASTGVRLLNGETGHLLEDRQAEFRIPPGWRWNTGGLLSQLPF